MRDWEEIGSVAYCGLVCSACTAEVSECAGCRSGDGDTDCPIRDCCVKAALQGCWECERFPCDRGAFGSEDWRGLSVALVQAAQIHSLQGLQARMRERLDDVIDYGAFRGLSPDEVRSKLDV